MSEVKEATEQNIEDLAMAVDEALAAIKDLEEEPRAKATALKEALEKFHKESLTTLVKRLKADARGKELLVEALEDPSVYALFSMHGIIKPPIEARILEVLEQIKPQIASHGGAIELVKVEDDVAFVRLHGACAGCSMSAQTLRDGVEEAVKARVPEISRVEQLQDMVVSGFLSIDNARGSSASAPGADSGSAEQAGWVEGPMAESISQGGIYHMKEAGAIISNTDGKLFAYRNSCPHMGQPLDGGAVEGDTLTCPFHGFKFLLESGECITAPQVQLQPFPLKVIDGKVWVRPA